MLSIDIDDTVIVQQRRALEAALSTNESTARALRRVIRKAVMEARARVSASVGGSLKSDPRAARRAVRTVTYRKVLGANINIYDSRHTHARTDYRPPRQLDSDPHRHGGNRRPRSQRTQQVMDYGPLDRGFILRFVNSGTATRHTVYGNRGAITARHFFRGAAEREMAEAANRLAGLIDEEIARIMR